MIAENSGLHPLGESGVQGLTEREVSSHPSLSQHLPEGWRPEFSRLLKEGFVSVIIPASYLLAFIMRLTNL
jgi:hypothetical protein